MDKLTILRTANGLYLAKSTIRLYDNGTNVISTRDETVAGYCFAVIPGIIVYTQNDKLSNISCTKNAYMTKYTFRNLGSACSSVNA